MEMPYAKTSLRAEQRSLREKMRALGMSHRQIAVEFARRYRMRPRAAWRHAYGWSQTEAAERINTYAAHAGLGPDSETVTLTGPHLCEHENWPGEGSQPTGRRPTPYLLSLLAAVYGCTVHDLLDVADYEHMPSADLLIIGKSSPAEGQYGHGQPPAALAEPRGVPQARVVAAPPSADHSAGARKIAAPAAAGTGVRGQQDGPGSLTTEHPGLGGDLPGSGALGRLSERALILAAAHESSAHAGWAEGSNVGEATLEQLEADVRRIACDYVYVPPLPMFAEMLRVRNRIYRLLTGRQKPAAAAHLHLLAGLLCGLLANASTDLGYRDAAAEQARAAWAYADIAGHNGLRSWTRGMQALIEYWSGRPQHAVRLAQGAKPYAGSGTARVRLHAIEARAWSLLGEAQETSRCLGAAREAGESPAAGDYLHDDVGGVFGFGDAKSHCYAAAAFTHLGQADAAVDAASRAVSLYAAGPAAQRSYGAESLARADMAAAHLLRQCLDGAAESLEPVLMIPPGLRIAQLGERLAGLRARLGEAEFSDAREARDLRERIGDFCRETVVKDLGPPQP
ncbi:MAG TPA: hypothetical protein VIV12_22990 [Streptosporangiaceae bacterium]